MKRPENSWRMNEWATWWREEIGVNVIPADTKNKKIKLSWKEWQSKPIPDSLHKFWCETGEFERGGIAVIMGKCWHKDMDLYLYSIDCDNQKAIDILSSDRNNLISGTLCEWHDDNPGKMHVYGYTKTPIAKKSSDRTNKDLAGKLDANDIPAIEIKSLGEHGLMFCSPSFHKSGYRYRIGPCHIPKETTNIESHLREVLGGYGIEYGIRAEIAGGIEIDVLLDGNVHVLEGHNRHLAILRVAEHYAATVPNLDLQKLIEMTKAKNLEICKPSLPDMEIGKLCTQAMKFVNDHGGLPRIENGKKKRDGDVELHVKIADEIMQNYEFVAIEETGEILFYAGGVYRFGADRIISKSARKINSNIKRADIAEITEYIRDIRGYVSLSEFDADPLIVNVRNGLYNLRTRTLQEHDHQYYSMMQIPHRYDKGVIPYRFLKFLTSCHPDDMRKVKTVIEMMSLCLIRDDIAEKSFLNVGSGSNGKSICLEFLGCVLGKANISTDSIHEISYDRFATSDLLGKFANICADIESHELKNTGNLKKIISGDRIRGQKKYGHAFPFEPSVKMIFSANQLPEVFDDSDGFYRKWEIIQWDKRFFGSDRDFSVKTIKSDKNELSGMLGIMLYHAGILSKTNRLSYARSTKETRELWKEKSDPIELFVSTEIRRNTEARSSVYDVYVRYKAWCMEMDRIPATNTKFNKTMQNNGYEKKVARLDGTSKHCWLGCEIVQKVQSQLNQS